MEENAIGPREIVHFVLRSPVSPRLIRPATYVNLFYTGSRWRGHKWGLLQQKQVHQWQDEVPSEPKTLIRKPLGNRTMIKFTWIDKNEKRDFVNYHLNEIKWITWKIAIYILTRTSISIGLPWHSSASDDHSSYLDEPTSVKAATPCGYSICYPCLKVQVVNELTVADVITDIRFQLWSVWWPFPFNFTLAENLCFDIYQVAKPEEAGDESGRREPIFQTE